MSPRDTGTGAVLEQMILPSLVRGGYQYQVHVNVGLRFGGGKHLVDVIAQKEAEKKILISLKWQQVQGTAEQKVPFEVMCLIEELLTRPEEYKVAYLILSGDNWKLKDFYISGGLKKHLKFPDLVNIITLEKFVSLSNRGLL